MGLFLTFLPGNSIHKGNRAFFMQNYRCESLIQVKNIVKIPFLLYSDKKRIYVMSDDSFIRSITKFKNK